MAKKEYKSQMGKRTAKALADAEKADYGAILGNLADEVVAVVEAEDEPPYEATKDDLEPDMAEDSIPSSFYSRDTLYITYEQHVALQVLSMKTSKDRSSIVREILDKGLEEMNPGIFEETKTIAQAKKKAEFDKLTPEQAARAVKRAAKG